MFVEICLGSAPRGGRSSQILLMVKMKMGIPKGIAYHRVGMVMDRMDHRELSLFEFSPNISHGSPSKRDRHC